MSSGSNNLTTYYAKRIIGDTAAANASSALLQTGTGIDTNTWILNRTNRVSTYGIKYIYDSSTSTVEEEGQEPVTVNNGHDKIEFHGGGANASAWVQLDTGDIYTIGSISGSNLSLTGPGTTEQGYDSNNTNPYIEFKNSDNTKNIRISLMTTANDKNGITINQQNNTWSFLSVQGHIYLFSPSIDLTNVNNNNGISSGTLSMQVQALDVNGADFGILQFSAKSDGATYNVLCSRNIVNSVKKYIGIYSSLNKDGTGEICLRNTAATTQDILVCSYTSNENRVTINGAVSVNGNGIQFPTTSGNNLTNNWISAGGGYGTGTGKSGVKLIVCEQSDAISGLGQDCGGGSYELSIISPENPSTPTTSYIRFLRHSINTPTSYTQLAEINGAGCFKIGYRQTTTGPSSITYADRITIVPYFHTGGPWYIKSGDDSTSAYLALYYNATQLMRIKHDGTQMIDWKGNASTATKWASAQTVYVTLGTASTTTTLQGGSSSAQTIGVNGTLGVGNGGTGKASWTANGIVYASATNTLAQIGAPSNSKALCYNSSAYTWVTYTSGNTANTLVYRTTSGNFSAGTITATFSGNLTGNVTGNCSGSSGSCTGHAASDLALSGGTMTGAIQFNSKGSCSIYNGPNDAGNGYNGALNNLVISSWYGVSFTTSCASQTCTGKNAFSINCRNGYAYAGRMYNAVWNDYAEFRRGDNIEPGRCMIETSSGIMTLSNKRLQPGAKIISDTYGYSMGETEETKTPIAVSGRVLAYPYRAKEEYPLGAAVCSAPNGTVDIMTREEIMKYPERIVGTVSEIPTYEIWSGGAQNGNDNIQVNGRIWIYVR